MMKRSLLLLTIVLTGFSGRTQNINMTAGGNSSVCSGTFKDGGGNGNYAASQNNIVHTLCPSTAGNKLRLTFTAFNTENNFDQLEIFDGNSTAAPSFGIFQGTPAVPFIVQASASNPSGCLTFRFKSDGSFQYAGWAADITCFVPCQTINSNFVSSTPAPGGDGIIRACQGQSVTFTGSGTFSNSGTGATYLWDFGDGTTGTGVTASHSYAAGGSYKVNLKITDPNGCVNANLLNKFVYVSTTPTLTTSATPATICQGQTSTLVGGVTMTPFVATCTPPVSGTTFLPDGSGVSYETSINVDCYTSGATITSANDFQNVCINMEHSYCGDVEIEFRCPNGQIIQLKPNAGGGTYLGSPIDNTTGGPGTGRLYCFTPTATVLMNAAPTSSAGTPAGASLNAGNYKPSQSFAGLVGCPLNGTWTIVVTDHLAADDGYIFSWDFNLSTALGTQGSFTPTVASQGWVANPALSGMTTTNATAAPTTLGSNCYTYSVTDNFGCTYTKPQCITVTPGTVPTFAAVASVCQGATAPTLPTTSTNGFTGTWAPATSTATAGTFTYTFTPTAGQCATTTTITVTVNAPTVPTFNPIAAFCQGSAAPTLSGTSTNGIAGTWSPSTVSNTASGTYTFTPNAGLCATTASMSITVNTPVTPTFNPIAAFCSGSTAPTLPASSTNGINGTWSPATVNNTTSGTYTFTPSAGQCATTASISITVTPQTVPSFTAIPAFCQGTTPAPTLPGTSNNSIDGTWSPATVNNMASGTYTFTPTAGQCATTASMSVTVNTPVTPTFTAIPAFCQGTTPVPTLPATSNNGFGGTWSPSTISNTASGTYTFTPTAGQCATTASLSVTVNMPVTPTFAAIPPFCEGTTAPTLPGTSTNGFTGTWSPSTVSNTASGSYTFTPTAGQCASTTSITITVTPPPVPTFNPVGPFCEGAAISALPTSPTNAPAVTGTWSPAINNMATTTYTYTPSAGQCSTTTTLTITINAPTVPSFTAIPPFCEGGTAPTLPGTSNNGIAGTWTPSTVSNTASGSYTFTPNDGQCATTASLSVTVTPQTTPTFNPIPPLCGGATAPALQTTSNNGITGTWNPAVINNSATGNYLFTPTAGQCASTLQITVTVGPPTAPIFDPITICQGEASPPALQNPSSNGVTGTWSPAVINPNSNVTYSFTPSAGLCATSTTFTVTLTPPTVPTFAAIPPFCEGTAAPSLPLSSTNSPALFGSWNPSTISNTTGGTYTFTPNAGQCATTASLTVTLTPPNTPTFAAIPPFCQGETPIPTLPATSNEGYTGSWGPAVIDNMAAGTYTFTPDAGQCSTTGSLSVTLSPDVPATFAAIAPFCEGTAAPSLPATSNEGFNGTWNPATIDNMASGTYTFTPTIGQCASSGTLSVTITPPTVPTFDAVGPYCEGTAIPALPTTSNEGFAGTWAPAIDNMASGTYTFTPNAGVCATTASLSITIDPPVASTFNPIAPICGGDPAPVLPATSNEGFTGSWNPATVDNTTTGTYTFTPDPGQCATTGSVTVTVGPPATPTFNAVGPFCEGESVPGLQVPSNEGVPGTWSPAVIDNMASGTYTFTPDAGVCATTASLSVVIDPRSPSTFNPIPSFCAGTAAPSLPATSNEGISGTWAPAVVDNMNSGTYTFNPDPTACATTGSLSITVDPLITPSFTAIPLMCENEVPPALENPSANGIMGTWSPATINTSASGTSTYTFTPDPGICASTATLDAIVGAPDVPLFSPVGPFCEGDVVPALNTTSDNAIVGTWTPSTIDNMASGTYTFLPDPGYCATTASLSVVVNTPVTPTFTQLAAVCSNATAPTLPTVSNNGYHGFWNPPTVSIAAGGTTTYLFTPDAGQCATTASMDITVNVAPTAAPETKLCDATGDNYTVTVVLSGGDPSSYSFTEILPGSIGGSFSGSTWTSNLIPSGTAYEFEMDDANGCGPIVVQGIKNCDCLTDAGTMDNTPISLCEGDLATAIPNGDETLDANDVVSYIIHDASGAILGNVFASGSTPTFAFTPPMTYETTYYISTVAGNNDGSGSVDMSDPCLSIAVGTPVIWHLLPIATAINDSPACPGEDVILEVNKIPGATYSWTGPNTFTSTSDTPVLPAITGADIGTYSVTITYNGCTSLPATTDVILNPLPTATPGSNSPICEGDDILLTAANVAGANYDWTGPNGFASTTQNPTLTGATAADAGTYTLVVTQNGCPSLPATVDVVVNPIPVITAPDVSTCLNVPVDLTVFGATSYTWTAGVNPTTGSTVTADGSGPLTVTVTGTTAGCSASTTVDVTISTSLTISVTPASPSICSGGTVALTATGGTNYTWTPNTGLDNDNVATVNASPGSTQTYTVDGEASGCMGTTTVTVTVNAPTVPTFAAIPAVCEGSTAPTLPTTSTNGISGTWSSAVSTVSPGTTAYTFTPDGGQCAASTTLSVTVNAKTVPTFNAMPAVCQGTAVANLPTTSLNGIPGGWSPGITTTNPGTYNYTFTPAAGQCATTAGNSLVVNALPNISVASVTTCPNVPVVLNATGGAGGTYNWSPGTGLSSTTGSSVTCTTSTTTTYTVTNVNNGCTGTASATVTIASSLSITVNPSAPTICAGDCVTLDAFGGTTYTWSPATGLSSTAGSSVTACPTVTTTYSVLGNTSGCTGTTNVVVTVNPLPTLTQINPITVCAGDVVNIPGFSQPSVTWTNSDQNIGLSPSGVGNISSFTASNAFGTPLTATITATPSANGCTGPAMTFTITVNPLPTVTAGVDQEVCDGDQVTLSGGGASTYGWTPAATNGSAFAPPVGVNVYTVVGTDANGCIGTDAVTITVNALPVVNAGPDQTVCAGFMVTLTATGGGAGSNYTWPNPIANGVAFDPISTQTFTVDLQDANGCHDTDDVTVTVEAAPVPDFASDVNSGCAPATITFTNNTVTASDNCTWNFGDGSVISGCGPVTHVYGSAGLYDVTLTMESANGCVGTTTINDMISIEALPNASFYVNPTEISVLDPVTGFFNETTGASNYSWSFGDGSVNSSEFSPEHTFPGNAAGNYLVTLVASTPGGCLDSTSLVVRVKDELLYFVPNTFTPDGNEVNNTFKPVFTAGYDPQDYHLSIFNRWGELIFESRNPDFGWDGTYENVMRDEGIYVWKIEFRSSETDERIIITGHVNLLK